MPDNGTIFNPADQATTTTSNTATSTTSTGTDDSELAILVGEGRKYSNPAELAKAYLKADDFIETLKTENATLREQAAKAKTLDEVLQRLETSKATATDHAGKTDPVSAADVSKIVKDTITGLETQRTREANMARADAKMREIFGDKAKEVFDAEAKTPELRVALTNLAQVDADKFVALFTQKQGAASTSQVDSGTTKSTAAMTAIPATGRMADAGCKEYYDNLRKKNPAEYYSAAVQLKIHEAAQADPDKYFGRKR